MESLLQGNHPSGSGHFSYIGATQAVFTVLCACLLWAAYAHFFTRPRAILKFLSSQGIPGHKFRPFVGQLPELLQARKQREEDPALAASTDAGQWFKDQSQAFGKLWTFSLGAYPRVVLGDPTAARQAYVVHNDKFEKSGGVRSMRVLGEGLLTANGEHWTWQRRLINPAFSHKEMKMVYPTMVLCTEESLSHLTTSVMAAPSDSIDVSSVFSRLTLDIICRAAFGSQLESLFEPQLLQTLLSAFHQYLTSVGRAFQLSYVIPFFRYMPVAVNRKVWASQAIIRRAMERIVSVRLAQFKKREGGKTTVHPDPGTLEDVAGKEEGSPGSKVDLLELMMRSTVGLSKDASNSSKKALTVSLLMDNSITFLLAGHETTAQLLSWTALLLSQHPEWQEKARNEVNALFEENNGETPTFEQLSSLKLVGMILNESLRLYPPAGVVGRKCIETTKLTEEVTVPKGCEILIPICAIHKDKDLWGEDVNEFHPERFANGIGKAAKNPHAFMPFSLGPRTCIGQNFAIIEAKIILALFLRKFQWSVAPEYQHHPFLAITTKPFKGMPVKLSTVQ